ncbi:MAG: hypothetical protein HGA47_09415 [Zoogloea sp.]|nr:hypothetical protein [Zoogloea sp.]
MIDHNCAFDADFNRTDTLNQHVFAAAGKAVFADLVERAGYLERFASTLAAFDEACDNVPPEWWWVDDGVPTAFDTRGVRAMLSRFNDDSFWEEN